MKSQALNWFKLVISSTTGHLELGFQVFFPSHALSLWLKYLLPFQSLLMLAGERQN